MKARKKVRMVSIPKSEAEEKMKAAGYECAVIDGVLTFAGEHSAREVRKIAGLLERNGYCASWAIRKNGRIKNDN